MTVQNTDIEKLSLESHINDSNAHAAATKPRFGTPPTETSANPVPETAEAIRQFRPQQPPRKSSMHVPTVKGSHSPRSKTPDVRFEVSEEGAAQAAGGSPVSKPLGHSRPASSSTSLASTSTQGSSKSSRLGTPIGSMLELKRFFGKGRKKHEQGVTQHKHKSESLRSRIKKDREEKEREQEKIDEKERDKAERAEKEKEREHSKEKEKPHRHLNVFSSLKHKKHERFADRAPRNFGDVNQPVVLGKPPSNLDPNFVVHGPDFEAEWDPFHIFGLEPNSERMPFLESGITKYGEIGRDMGSGAGGSVNMMERPSDHKLFAVKEFRKRRTNETLQKYAKTVTSEYALGAALHHRNIIETIDLIKEGDKYYEVMEYGPHDFFEIVMSGKMTTAQINSSFHQIVEGVSYLHSMGVAHRDIKLDNCVVNDEGTVKLIDFGSAVIFKYPNSPKIHLARGILGSDPYLAPEVFERHPYQPQVADIWSCGILYCCAYLRRFPWKLPQPVDASFRKYSENSANIDGQHPPQDNPKKITGPWRILRLLPKDSRKLIAKILTIEVAERATLDDVHGDQWFNSIQEVGVLPDNYEDPK